MYTPHQVEQLREALSEFVELFKAELGRSERRYWCKYYLSGLLLEGKRKSIEPMSQRLPGGNEQALQQFVNQSPWSHEAVESRLLAYVRQHVASSQGVLVLDDTALPKKGQHSVGVSHQYCGALGKVANCQSIVSLHYSGRDAHVPLAGELYLPKTWINDPPRLDTCHVPEAKRQFRPKWQIALELLDKYREQFPPHEILVFDAGYGELRPFLRQLDQRDWSFVGQIPESHAFWPAEVKLNTTQAATGRRRIYPEIADKTQNALSAKQWAQKLIAERTPFKTVTLKLKTPRRVKATVVKVREVISEAYWRPGPERWLIIEQTADGTLKYYVSNVKAKIAVSRLLNWVHQRWTIEQGYQHMKQELGLDHFEGRSWRGLHHHLVLCFMAFVFLTLMRKKKTLH